MTIQVPTSALPTILTHYQGGIRPFAEVVRRGEQTSHIRFINFKYDTASVTDLAEFMLKLGREL